MNKQFHVWGLRNGGVYILSRIISELLVPWIELQRIPLIYCALIALTCWLYRGSDSQWAPLYLKHKDAMSGGVTVAVQNVVQLWNVWGKKTPPNVTCLRIHPEERPEACRWVSVGKTEEMVSGAPPCWPALKVCRRTQRERLRDDVLPLVLCPAQSLL